MPRTLHPPSTETRWPISTGPTTPTRRATSARHPLPEAAGRMDRGRDRGRAPAGGLRGGGCLRLGSGAGGISPRPLPRLPGHLLAARGLGAAGLRAPLLPLPPLTASPF